MKSISLCIVSNNDPENIVRCITPLSSQVDEILICDINNTMNKRAKDFNAKIVPCNFQDDFSEVKNNLLNQAKSDYVLFLDSCDILFKQAFRKLKIFLEKDDADAYLFPIHIYTKQKNLIGLKNSSLFEGFPGYTVSKKIALFKRSPEVVFSDQLSASPLNSLIKNKKITKEVTDVPIHLVEDSFKDLKKKILQKLVEESPDVPKLYLLGNIYMQDGNLNQAKECFEKVQNKDPHFKKVGLNLANLYLMEGDFHQAAETYLKIIDANPNNVTAHHNLGVLFRKSGKLDKAEWCFKKAISLKNTDPRLYKILALTYQDQGNLSKAKDIAALGHKITKSKDLLDLYNKL